MNKAILIVLDGYGEGKPYKYNAVTNANTPTLNELKTKSFSLLKTDSEAVGLFNGNMGGSEVGHTTIGAGRVIPSMAKKISDDFESGQFINNKNLIKISNFVKSNNSNLHLIGMMSDKNIHSNINHAYKLIDYFKDKAQNIFIHFITDGRDSGTTDSLKYLKELISRIKGVKNCEIASVSGRFYAMDRENYMERTNLAFNKMFKEIDGIDANSIEKYLKQQHKSGNNDQYILPTHVKTNADFTLKKQDVLLFFNFREDRMRQIVKTCEQTNCKVVTMAEVGGTNSIPLYKSEVVKNTLSEYLSKQNVKQIKISETTKYAHVTYFLNGGREQPFENEDRLHIPTKKTTDYTKTPHMRAKEIADAVCESMNKNYQAIIVNFSNPDMLGHTGDYDATVKSLEFLDKCLKKMLKTAKTMDYDVLITADHGNAEEMMTKQNKPQTAHTLNRVFCVVANKNYKMKKFGELKDVAPTFVELLGLKKCKAWTGESLIVQQ